MELVTTNYICNQKKHQMNFLQDLKKYHELEGEKMMKQKSNKKHMTKKPK